MNQSKQSSFQLSISDNGIGWITIDLPGETQNTLRAEFVEQINTLFDQIEANELIKALVLISGKENNFVAGADISMLEAINTADEATQLALQGHSVFNRLENLSMPVVAAIHGACLGGGLELALACSHRIITSDKSTRLGFPEVQLGVLPGGGGTQRLPRLIGIANALDLMLTGRQLVSAQAKKLGLVDEVVAPANLRLAAEKLALNWLDKEKRKISQLGFEFKLSAWLKPAELQKLLLETTSTGRNIIFDKAFQSVLKKTRGNYPAPPKIIECVRVGMEHGFSQGSQKEAELFGELVVSDESKQLMNIFFATNALKKSSGVETSVELRTIERVGVLGGGLMGAGIAFVTADKAGKIVRIKDANEQGINHALKYCWSIYRQRIKKRHISINEASKRFATISGTTNYHGFKRVDLVIEAVYENLELKQQMLKEIEEICDDKTIFATNTSSIPVSKIAQHAARPQNVIGLHYFSPVDKMPLLEVVVTPQTSDETIATCVDFGKQQGKTVIVVKDGTGFYTSRILGPYVNEAGHLITEGVSIEKIDGALKNAGFPVGPIALLDEVGIDVAIKIADILVAEFGDRMKPPSAFDLLIKDDRKGRKNARGFYVYTSKQEKSKRGKQVDQSIYPLLKVTPDNELSEQVIAQRCLLQMVNEAVLCLQEGILSSPRDGDIGAIFGLGFPPFLGGPFRYIDHVGATNIVEQLTQLQETCGVRFKPAQLLLDKARDAANFY